VVWVWWRWQKHSHLLWLILSICNNNKSEEANIYIKLQVVKVATHAHIGARGLHGRLFGWRFWTSTKRLEGRLSSCRHTSFPPTSSWVGQSYLRMWMLRLQRGLCEGVVFCRIYKEKYEENIDCYFEHNEHLLIWDDWRPSIGLMQLK
jgi:hypothetical protein